MEASHKYVITCKEYDSAYELHYDLNGQLVQCGFSGSFDEKQKQWWLSHTPPVYNEPAIAALVKGSKGVLQKVPFKLSFQIFYDTYGYKEGKKAAEKAWLRLSDNEKVKAFLYIPIFKGKLKLQGTAQPYPATYINQQRWND